MRGKKAKRIRKQVYGDYSIRARPYYSVLINRQKTGEIIADQTRKEYQWRKKTSDREKLERLSTQGWFWKFKKR